MSRVPHVPRWTTADILDFEYLLSSEESADATNRDARFRTEFQRKTRAAAVDRRQLFRQWLEMRRATHARTLPGRHFATGWRMLLSLALIGGFLLGAGVAAAHLSYHENEPINLPKLLLWTVGLQWLVMLVAALFWFFRRALPDLRDFYPLHALLWGVELAMRRLPGEQREGLRATVARLRHHREIYGSLMVWPTVIVTQLFAVFFNLGVLASILILGTWIVDLRFGWQTTRDLSMGAVHRTVAAFATPWRWAPDPFPTLEQLAVTRVEPGQSLRDIDPIAGRSWWPFLMYSVVCYGLLVRLALFIFAALRLRGEINAVRFDHAEANTLFRRLTGPVIQAEASPAGLEIPAGAPNQEASVHVGGAAIALVASDAEIDALALAERLQRQYQWKLLQTHPIEIDRPHGNETLLENLRNGSDPVEVIAVVVRAKRAPIRAMALVLEEIRAAATGKSELVLVLLGRKQADAFAAVPAEDLQHWKNFSAINRLHLSVEALHP